MILSAYMAKDADALACDMAQTYQVYSLEQVPLRTYAMLAVGLGSDSRIGRAITGSRVPDAMLMQAAILDGINILIWMQTKDGQKNRNRPTSIVERLTEPPAPKVQIRTFESGEEFMRERERLLRGG